MHFRRQPHKIVKILMSLPNRLLNHVNHTGECLVQVSCKCLCPLDTWPEAKVLGCALVLGEKPSKLSFQVWNEHICEVAGAFSGALNMMMYFPKQNHDKTKSFEMFLFSLRCRLKLMPLGEGYKKHSVREKEREREREREGKNERNRCWFSPVKAFCLRKPSEGYYSKKTFGLYARTLCWE